MLLEREELWEATGEDPPPPLIVGKIVRSYKELLSKLTFNSKPGDIFCFGLAHRVQAGLKHRVGQARA